MIVASLIGSIENQIIHCEWYKEDFTNYAGLRQNIHQFFESKIYLTQQIEVLNLKTNYLLHIYTNKGQIFLVAYEKQFPKKLGKAFLMELKENFDTFLDSQVSYGMDKYSYVETLRKSYSLLKFGELKRQNDIKNSKRI